LEDLLLIREVRMGKAKGIHAHKLFKLGKCDAKKDNRNLLFAAVLKIEPKIPNEYDFDLLHKGIPTPMFANDIHGDCVIAGRAHQTLRFEDIEQGSILMISDKDVLNEYLKETKGQDNGLVVLDSLKLWRKIGWKVGKNLYKINAFAEIQLKNHDEVKRAIYADIGIGIGLQLPISAQNEIQAGKSWEITTGTDSKIGSWGGHYVYVSGYTKIGPVCVTWARKQQMTWKWFDKYCDEAFAIFDAKDSFKKTLINKKGITKFLEQLS
jgi:hypothetical protein